jgi:hypothetical protein
MPEKFIRKVPDFNGKMKNTGNILIPFSNFNSPPKYYFPFPVS